MPRRVATAPASSTIAVTTEPGALRAAAGGMRSSDDVGAKTLTAAPQARTTRTPATTSLGRCHWPTSVETPVAPV